jgi:hypothetical protein
MWRRSAIEVAVVLVVALDQVKNRASLPHSPMRDRRHASGLLSLLPVSLMSKHISIPPSERNPSVFAQMRACSRS